MEPGEDHAWRVHVPFSNKRSVTILWGTAVSMQESLKIRFMVPKPETRNPKPINPEPQTRNLNPGEELAESCAKVGGRTRQRAVKVRP